MVQSFAPIPKLIVVLLNVHDCKFMSNFNTLAAGFSAALSFALGVLGLPDLHIISASDLQVLFILQVTGVCVVQHVGTRLAAPSYRSICGSLASCAFMLFLCALVLFDMQALALYLHVI
jgi:hypothetical protein